MNRKDTPEAPRNFSPPAVKIWRDSPRYLALYTVLWLLLSGFQGWIFGTVAVLLAACLSHLLNLRPGLLRASQIPGFLVFYLKELVVAGWQVALSACRVRMPVDPGWVSFPLKSRSTETQMMLATFVCLLPGTLASRVRDEKMLIHLLDRKQTWRPTVEELETRIQRLLGETGP